MDFNHYRWLFSCIKINSSENLLKIKKNIRIMVFQILPENQKFQIFFKYWTSYIRRQARNK